MNRNEFVVATAIVLLLAFTLGWFVHLIVQRFRRGSTDDMGELERLAQSLHDAEEARDEAVMQLEQRESELGNKLSQTEAELRAAMDGLGDARQEAEEMRAYIERMHSNSRS